MAQVTITIDIPDDVLEELKAFATSLGEPVEKIVADWFQADHAQPVGRSTDDLDEFARILEEEAGT